MPSSALHSPAERRTILGISFFTGAPDAAVELGLAGGLVVVPAAPALLALEHDAQYREALLESDLAITDSGFMVLLWWLFEGERLIKVSGVEYLRRLLRHPALAPPRATFWVMPSAASVERTRAYLAGLGLAVTPEDFHVAPFYGKGAITDPELLERIVARAPAQVVIGLGGGTQERLGLYLKRHLPGRPGIHCIGAAIAILTGEQGQLPRWADALFLGWLCRCLAAPRTFVPRYWRARRLFGLLRRHRGRLPELKAG